MASKGGKGGGQAQQVFGPRGGGFGGGGIFEQLRQQFPQFMPQQFAPVPPPMQTPGQQFVPFTGQPMPTDFGRQQPQQFAPAPPPITMTADQLQPQVVPFNQSPIPETFAPSPQFAPAPPPIADTFGQRGPPQVTGKPFIERVAPASPLGPLVNPRGGLRKGDLR